jgi:hypothetical protein
LSRADPIVDPWCETPSDSLVRANGAAEGDATGAISGEGADGSAAWRGTATIAHSAGSASVQDAVTTAPGSVDAAPRTLSFAPPTPVASSNRTV